MPVRAAALGRKRFDALVAAVVAEWPVHALLASRPGDERGTMALERLERRVRARPEYGNPLLIIALGAVLSTVIRLVLEWWLKRGSHRLLMAAWRDQANGQ